MKNNHINEDQLIKLIIDSTDLPHTIQSHLSECSDCQKKVKTLEKDLTQVGGFAQKYTPTPLKTIRYVPEKSLWESSQSWFFRTTFAAAAMMVILIIGILFTPTRNIINDFQMTDQANEALVEQQLMAEIWELEENYLMGFSVDINEDSDNYFDEDFWEFILPLEEEDNSAQVIFKI